MPPRPKFSSNDIIEAAFNIVRKYGWEGLTARSIAHELNSSTQPIYSYLKSMKNLDQEVVTRAMAVMHQYVLKEDRTGDRWVDQALGYVAFAMEEKHLFRCFNDEKHAVMRWKVGETMWNSLAEDLSDYEPFRGLRDEEIESLRTARWVYVHGMATLINSTPVEMFGEGLITELLMDVSHMLCKGYKEKYKGKRVHDD